jgi:hypothetical protein
MEIPGLSMAARAQPVVDAELTYRGYPYTIDASMRPE